MDESRNPYAPPKADLGDPSGPGATRKLVFSPRQGMAGALFGGPLAAIYCVRANYLAKGEVRAASTFTMVALVLTVVLLALLPLLPVRLPRVALPLVCGVTVQLIIEKQQFTKAELDGSASFAIHSNWWVAAVAALGVFAFLALYAGLALFFPSHFLHRPS